MRARSIPRSSLRGARPLTAALAALGVVIGSLLGAAPATAASTVAGGGGADAGLVKAAAVVGFNPENIINDALFYDGLSMTSAEIQAFLDAKIGACQNGRCLNVLSITADSKKAYYSQTTGNLVCGALTGGTMRASEYIYRVQVACGISAKVILVTMQKEQGLATDKAPTETELRRAMGHLCSDTAPCETAAAGIGNQIFGGTEQLKKYKATAFGKQPGRNWVGFNPSASCGGSYLNIQNYATAALYNYTPYQPNAAALAAGYGLGDKCSSYGNRNFFNYYTQWFGSTQAVADPCKAPDASVTTPATGEYTTTAGLNGRAAPNSACANVLITFPKGTVVTRVATFDKWWYVRVDGVLYWVHSDFLEATPAATFSVDRIQGADRYETAAAIAAQANPQTSPTVYIASGENFPDSVAGSALAAHGDSALLLTAGAALPAATATRLTALKPTRVVVLGGSDVISDAVLGSVRSAVGAQAKIERIAGADRYETARLLAKSGWTSSAKAYVATGTAFPDALSASSAAAAQDAPVILVDGSQSSVPAPTIQLIRNLGVKSIVIAGGPQAVSAGIEAQLRGLGITVDRRSGVDRYDTSLLLARSASATTSRMFLASGVDFPDALSGSVLSGSTGSPLLLQSPACMSGAAKDFALSAKATRVTLLGGPAALSDAVAAAIRC